MFSASADAARSAQPQAVRIVMRPLVDGKIGEVLASKSIYLMVIEKP